MPRLTQSHLTCLCYSCVAFIIYNKRFRSEELGLKSQRKKHWSFPSSCLPQRKEGAELGSIYDQLWVHLQIGHSSFSESASHKNCFKQSPLRDVRIIRIRCFLAMYRRWGPNRNCICLDHFMKITPKFYDKNFYVNLINTYTVSSVITAMYSDSSTCHSVLDLGLLDVTDNVGSCSFLLP